MKKTKVVLTTAEQSVMYTWFNPFAFDVAEQQKVLDQFYAAHPNAASVNHTATVSGKSNHPNIGVILPFMQAWDKQQGR